MRAQHFDEAFFSRKIEFKAKMMARFAEKARAPDTAPAHRASVRYSLFRFDLEQLIQRYSRGDPLATLPPQFPRIAAEHAEYRRDPNADELDFANIDQYCLSLWLVSFAILFDVGDEVRQTLLDVIGARGRDALFDRLVAREPSAAILVHPRYAPLVAAIDGNAPALQLQKFLAGWYRSMKDVYWYDSHTIRDSPYFGYFCFEAAAVVKAFAIDDAPFADHPHYPRDLLRSPGAARDRD